MSQKVITRFAPSPTGFLHIGGARTALFNWVYAKKMKGEMLLRIEDTDRERYNEDAIKAIFDGLKWLGLNWDGEPISQFENKKRHAQIANQLVKEGKAYKCYCSSEELTQMRDDAKKQGNPPHYSGKWRNKDEKEAPADINPVIRIKTPIDQKIIIKDHVQGDVVFDTKNLDDFIILRSDGTPTYMLAVVVDDYDMKVTHIIRGDDHLTNAARQVVIYNALGWEVPQMAHIPLIHGADGAKLSKRHGALGVDAYRKQGYLPDAVRNYLARLGFSHGDDEIFSTDQMIKWFDIDELNKGAARFDFVKLANINAHYIRQTEPKELYIAMLDLAKELKQENDVSGLLEKKETIISALPFFQPRAKTVLDLLELSKFVYIEKPIKLDEKSQELLSEENKKIISLLTDELEKLENWTLDDIKENIKTFCEKHELKLGKVAQPLRAALTGGLTSPGVFELIFLLNKQETLSRLKE